MVMAQVTGTKLSAGDARRDVDATNGFGGWSDMSRGNGGVPRIYNCTDTTTDMMETISTHRDAAKRFN